MKNVIYLLVLVIVDRYTPKKAGYSSNCATD